MTFSGQGERFVNRPWGLFGGGSGGTGKFVKRRGERGGAAADQAREPRSDGRTRPSWSRRRARAATARPPSATRPRSTSDFVSGKFGRDFYRSKHYGVEPTRGIAGT